VHDGVTRRVVIVGGGITGLSAGWELVERAEVVVVDAAPRTGGSIAVSPVGGRLVDEAADSFLRRVPEGLELAAEMGLVDQLVSPAATDAAVWIEGAIRKLPSPHVLGVPTDLDAARASGTLGDEALRALAAEPELVGAPLKRDESIGSVIRRRLGDEVLERLVEPLVGGINAGEADRLSIQAVTPQLADAASRSASLLTGLATVGGGSGTGSPIFAGLPGGMGSLVETLTRELTARGAEFRLGSPVRSLKRHVGGWRVQLDTAEVNADGVVVCTPARVTAQLLAQTAPAAAELIGAIRSASVAMVTVVVPASTPLPSGLSGVLVPRTAGLTVTAVSIASQKWSHLAGGDHLLRVSVGHDADPTPLSLADDELLSVVVADLSRLFDVEIVPGDHRIRRYPDGLPQYEVGHLERIAQIDQELSGLAGVEVTGSWARGLGIPACIRQGRQAARRVVASLL
jgi:oxygen-dependent protoporphyrinogen oxidase